MIKLLLTVGLLYVCYGMHAQVGIGTILPSAQLEISSDITAPNFPLLELNPQNAPVGSATGQLAVIGDRLYMYDSSRSKWLSVETSALQYGYSYGADDQELFFGGDIGLDTSTEGLTGAKMPFNGTIVYMTIESSGGASNKSFEIVLNGVAIGNNTDPTLDGRVKLSSNTFSRTTYNIDFSEGDYLTIKARSTGGAVHDPAAIIWVKWRQ